MDWLKVIGFIIPSIALIFSFSARLKRFNNERISVYKDMKSLSSDLKKEEYEIKVIDDELKQLILQEVTGIYEITPARRLMKILSCNPNLEPFEKNRLKKIIQCVNEKEHIPQEKGGNINFELDKDLYKKRAKEGTVFIIAFFIGYITFLISGFPSIVREEYSWATTQIIMSFTLLIAMLFTKNSYPAPWQYKAHKKFIEELRDTRVIRNNE